MGDYDPFAEDDPFGASDPFAEDGSGEVPSDEAIIEESHKWVHGVIVHMKVCPFSSSVEKAGMPIGGVTYPICHAETGEGIYHAFWSEVAGLDTVDERTVATVLLITPRFAQYSAGAYDAFADTLNSALTDLQFEDDIQLVFFHPEYTFRDGKQRVGDSEEAAANFARRSPYPMINVLRTPQVRAAQKGIPTGSVYELNEKNLHSVGVSSLQKMLDERDWSALEETKFEKHNSDTWTL